MSFGYDGAVMKARADAGLSGQALKAREILALDDAALLEQCELDTYRSSGPGGQKRNKTSSAVRLRHTPTGLMVTAAEDRSQHVNKARAIRRLREAIAMHVRRADSPAGDVSELLRACVGRDGSFAMGRRDQRYPLVVGELLDVLAACEVAVGEAAKRVGTSTAQLIKLAPTIKTKSPLGKACARSSPGTATVCLLIVRCASSRRASPQAWASLFSWNTWAAV